VFCVTVAKHGTCDYLRLRSRSELYSAPSGAIRAIGTVKDSLGEASGDNVFVNRQGEIIRGNAPETGKGEAIGSKLHGAAAAYSAWRWNFEEFQKLHGVQDVATKAHRRHPR
jgi:hypothetical protein